MKKILVHIGTGKTGTTTIQRALLSAHRKKELKGFSYPDLGEMSHQPIVLLCQEPFRFSRGYRQKYSGNKEKIRAATDEVKKTLELECSTAKNVVLSAEYFSVFTKAEVKIFKKLLEVELGSPEVNIIVYVRDPLAYYSSMLQQNCKASALLIDPSTFYYNFKGLIKLWENVFRKKIFVRPFKKELLFNGCVVNDFCRLVSKVFSIEEPVLKVVSHNQSMSLESLSILVAYRELFYSDKDNIFTEDTNRFLNILSSGNLIDNNTSLILKNEIKTIIYKKHKEDLFWLKDKYDIDYTNQYFGEPGDDGLIRNAAEEQRIEIHDLFEGFDEQKNRNLLLRVLNEIMTSSALVKKEQQSPLKS